MTRFNSPNFGIDDIQSIKRNLYIDCLSTPGNVNKIAVRGAAMTPTPKPRKAKCYNLSLIHI